MFETVTVFNLKRNPITKYDEYQRTVLHAHWESEQGIRIGDTNITTNNQIVVVFPIQDGFLLPNNYKVESNVSGKWTLAPGDVIFRGDVQSYNSISDEKMTITTYEVNTTSFIPRLRNITAYGK